MTVDSFEEIFKLVEPYLRPKKDTRPIDKICPLEKFAVVMEYLASGSIQRHVASIYRISKQHFGTILDEVCVAIVKALENEIPPLKINEFLRISNEFNAFWNLPNCLGAIDGKHVAIKCPANAGSLFYNYKGFHSIVLMAIAEDANCKFIYIDVGAYGSEGDANVFASTKIGKLILKDELDLPLDANVGTPWKAPINLIQEAHERGKRSASESPYESRAKRQKISEFQEDIPENVICMEYPDLDKPPRIMFSQVLYIDRLTKAVLSLGGLVVEDPTEANYLVMTREARTCKLIHAICHVDFIVKSAWLEDSAKSGKFLSPENYKIQYIEVDENIKVPLERSLMSTQRRTLFVNKYFYVRPDVFPPRSEIVRMIVSSGGKVEENRRTVKQINETCAESPDNYIIITCPQDLPLLVYIMRQGKPKCWILTTEFVLSSILM